MSSNLYISRAVHLFLKSSRGLDADTRKAYALDLNSFMLSFDRELIVTEIRSKDVSEYLDNLTNKKTGERVSLSTQNRHYATLRRFFAWLLREGYVEENIFDRLQRRRPDKDLGELPSGSIIRAINSQVVKKILSNCKNLREKTLFMLIYTTGLRVSEALSLRIEDIEGDSVLVRSTKGNKPRKTYISQALKPLLKKHIQSLLLEKPETKSNFGLGQNGWLFPSRKKIGQPLSYYRARQLFDEITQDLRNSDGSKLTIHQLRHTFATERAGYIDSILLMNLMGHSDIRTTLRYAKATARATKQAFESFDQNFSLGLK